jgi:pimeloyl-ACP methyl ester carboxylesterase
MEHSKHFKVSSNGYELDTGMFNPAEDAKSKGVIIYCCGFPGDINTSKKISYSFSQLGYMSYYFDYRGIRKSEGTLDFIKQVDDLQSIVSFIQETSSSTSKIIVVGHGFGGRVAICASAIDERIDGCVVWESIGDTREEMKQWVRIMSWRLYNLLWVRNVNGKEGLMEKIKNTADLLNPVECIRDISPRPVLIIHRRRDPMVSVDHAFSLWKNALDPKEFILDNGWMHSDDDVFFTSTKEESAISFTDVWIMKNIVTLQD